MNLDPLALADALRAYAETLHQQAQALPILEAARDGMFADELAAKDVAGRIERRARRAAAREART